MTKPTHLTFFQYLRGDRKRLGLFSVILLFCFFSKIPRLGNPRDFYFDEVYHGYTATLYLHGDARAYDPWAKAPEGKGFEWTHPPLSKLTMAGMMRVFGENAFGWRIGSVIFGTAATVATAVFAFELFQSGPVALLAMFLMSLETLVFAQSRIAMNDMYLIFFMMLALIHYVRWRRSPERLGSLYLTGLALGLAIATKWTTLWVFIILFVDFGGQLIWKGKYPKKTPFLHIPIALGMIPVAIYLASYTQFFWLGGSWDSFVKLQSEMWRYHNNLSATHAYSSVPWQWLLNVRPVWMHVDYSVPDKVGHIYNIGNSVIFYSGLYAVYAALFREKARVWTWERWFILLVYFGVWLPWSFSPRIMLFYHYTPAIPALCVLLARWLARMLEDPSPSRPRIARLILVGAFGWFVLFYPHLTGIPVSPKFADRVYFPIPSMK